MKEEEEETDARSYALTVYHGDGYTLGKGKEVAKQQCNMGGPPTLVSLHRDIFFFLFEAQVLLH